ncbi:transposase [Pseudonocardia sp. Ae717_Ps2]|uniref:transposase n=1 Tax=Pseudonocardia sp. Ae717_Ps2 TaxID=1885573 RepID=UPI00350FDA8D
MTTGGWSAARQTTAQRTTGTIGSCQLGMSLAYASNRGPSSIDRELCLPTSWTEDRERHYRRRGERPPNP